MPKNSSLSSIGIPYSIVKYIESDNMNEVKMVLDIKEEQILGYDCENLKSKFGEFYNGQMKNSFSAIWKDQSAWLHTQLPVSISKRISQNPIKEKEAPKALLSNGNSIFLTSSKSCIQGVSSCI